jgi:multisubunit Na+/H+ antiporter MnhB subunit
VIFVVLVATGIAFALLTYWRRNKSARRAYLHAFYLVLGLGFAAVAAMLYSDPSVARRFVWAFAVMAVAYPVAGIWASRRRDINR